MSQELSATPETPERDNPAANVESRGLQWLLRVGAVLSMVIWALWWRSGLIQPWDRWLLPLMACAFALHAWLIGRLPSHGPWVRLSAVATFNAYLVASVHMLLAIAGAEPNVVYFVCIIYWLPLAYGTAFVYLPVKWAVSLAVVVFGACFGPIGFAALSGGGPTLWPADFSMLVIVVGTAQLTYILLLGTVATVRSDYRMTHERMELMQTLAATDSLTNLPNRRAMTESLTAALALAQRQGQPVVVALIDVDHFKRINDQHGHGVGDQVLVQLARVLSTQLRASDRLGRWGGEEFLMVAPATPMHAGLELAERLRRAVEAWQFPHGEPLTVSVGVSQVLAGDDADMLLLRADKALYRAKELGRNRSELLAVAVAP